MECVVSASSRVRCQAQRKAAELESSCRRWEGQIRAVVASKLQKEQDGCSRELTLFVHYRLGNLTLCSANLRNSDRSRQRVS